MWVVDIEWAVWASLALCLCCVAYCVAHCVAHYSLECHSRTDPPSISKVWWMKQQQTWFWNSWSWSEQTCEVCVLCSKTMVVLREIFQFDQDFGLCDFCHEENLCTIYPTIKFCVWKWHRSVCFKLMCNGKVSECVILDMCFVLIPLIPILVIEMWQSVLSSRLQFIVLWYTMLFAKDCCLKCVQTIIFECKRIVGYVCM